MRCVRHVRCVRQMKSMNEHSFRCVVVSDKRKPTNGFYLTIRSNRIDLSIITRRFLIFHSSISRFLFPACYFLLAISRFLFSIETLPPVTGNKTLPCGFFSIKNNYSVLARIRNACASIGTCQNLIMKERFIATNRFFVRPFIMCKGQPLYHDLCVLQC